MALAILSVPKEKLRDEGGCEINTAHIYQMAKNDTKRTSKPDGPSLFFIRFYKKKQQKSCRACQFCTYTRVQTDANKYIMQGGRND